MKYIYQFLILLIITSCNTSNKDQTSNKLVKDKNTNVLRIHIQDKVTNIFPTDQLNESEYSIAQQVFESLFKYNPQSLKIEKCLIKNYYIDSTKTKYTFELKDHVLFHKSALFKSEEERILKTSDVLYCLDRLIKKEHLLSNIIVNDPYKKELASGLIKIDNQKFIIKLNQPNALFLHVLTGLETSIYPKKSIEFSYNNKTSNTIGTGPFKVKSDYKNNIVLTKNREYYLSDGKGFKLPYLNEIQFINESNIDKSLEKFERSELDLIKHLPSDHLFDLQYLKHQNKINIDIHHQPMASLDFIGFGNESTFTNNQYLQLGLSLAIDKTQLMNRSLNGEAGHPAIKGFTPEVFSKIGYTIDQLSVHKTDLDSAKKLIDLAFNDQIKNLSIAYDKEDYRHQKIIKSLSKLLKEKLEIDLLVHPLTIDSLDFMIKNNKSQIYLKTYNYKYFHPLDFMNYLSKNNIVTNEISQKLSGSTHTRNNKNTFEEYLKIEKSIVEENQIIALWSNEYYEVMQPDIENLSINAIQYYDLRNTYIKQIEQLRPIN